MTIVSLIVVDDTNKILWESSALSNVSMREFIFTKIIYIYVKFIAYKHLGSRVFFHEAEKSGLGIKRRVRPLFSNILTICVFYFNYRVSITL